MSGDTEARDLLLDSDGDLTITDNDFVFATGITACAQEIKQRIAAIKGEWFLDLDLGVPYFEDIFGQKFNQAKMEQIYRAEIAKVDGVDAINSLSCTWEGSTRTMVVAWEVQYGEDTISDEEAIEV